ncbi:hypothetical protein P5B29_002630, partial [Enterococcus faecium]|nr:hypothetical protein [Enterococcus faecium]EMF0589917.1 hypothetical protein [Enterococcus faecium]
WQAESTYSTLLEKANGTYIAGYDVLTEDRNKVMITAKDQVNQTIVLGDLTKKTGNYTITYSYNGKSIEVNLTVEDSYYMIIPKISMLRKEQS